VEATAKLVNRESLPNQANGISIIIGQRVLTFPKVNPYILGRASLSNDTH